MKLMMILLRDVGRLMIASWNMICYIMIILYVAKNSGITGIILPILLFVWVLVDERVIFENL